MNLYQITSYYFCAGLEFKQNCDIVKEAAPIIHYMKGWTRKEVIEYCAKKQWQLQKV